MLNVAAPPVEGRTTAWKDLGILSSLAVIGFVVSLIWMTSYLWAGVAISTVAAAFLWLARRPEPGFRWAGTGAVGAFAAVVLLGIFSGLIVRTATWLSDDDFSITYPDFYQWAVVVVTLALVAVVIALGIYGARASSSTERRGRRRRRLGWTRPAIPTMPATTLRHPPPSCGASSRPPKGWT